MKDINIVYLKLLNNYYSHSYSKLFSTSLEVVYSIPIIKFDLFYLIYNFFLIFYYII